MKIFVFGSNLAGRHGKGAALFAKQHHGAIQGIGEGLQGSSYAIPTKDSNLRPLPLLRIAGFIFDFQLFAAGNQGLQFQVTPIGCGLAGYNASMIAPMFANSPPNVELPPEFITVLGDINNDDKRNS